MQSLFPSSIPPGIQPHVRICVVDYNAIHRVFHWADDMRCVMVLLYLSFALPFVPLLHCFSHVLHMFLFSHLASIAHLRYKNKNYWCITDEDCIAQGKLYTAALPTAVRCVSVFFRLTFFFFSCSLSFGPFSCQQWEAGFRRCSERRRCASSWSASMPRVRPPSFTS